MSVKFRFLKFADKEWVARVQALPYDRRDIHFDPRILAPYLKAYGWDLRLTVTGDPDTLKDFVIQPILVTKEGELRHAYNFGGPVGDNNGIYELYNAHRAGIDVYKHRAGIKKEFGTLNPFLTEHQKFYVPNYKHVKDSVYIDLSQIKPRGTTRRLANKAQGLGVQIGSYHIYTHLHHFLRLYEQTMSRVGAEDNWKFGNDWFMWFAKFLYPHLLLATYEGKVIAACLVVHKGIYPVAYYHFAASSDDCPIRVNQMMVLAAAELVKSRGAKYLYLGGGLTDEPRDGLFVFKSGFSKLRLPVISYRC